MFPKLNIATESGKNDKFIDEEAKNGPKNSINN